jgi:hypothetical protein
MEQDKQTGQARTMIVVTEADIERATQCALTFYLEENAGHEKGRRAAIDILKAAFFGRVNL